jgi:hypothetical protein
MDGAEVHDWMLQHLEELSEASHDGWMEGKLKQGISSRPSEAGEELMVPYQRLSEQAKELDRAGVRSVAAAARRIAGR